MATFLLGVYVVTLREILRFFRNRARATSSLASPFLWLGIFGLGLQGAFQTTALGHKISYIDFLLPGVVAQTALFAGIFGALSIVADREFGFVKELLVAPIPRSSVAVGKTLGAALIATVQGMMTLLVSMVIGAKVTPWQVLSYLPTLLLFAYAASALGFLIAARIHSQEAFQAIVPIVIFPLFFLSGALFPLQTAPPFLKVLAIINPVTYGVDLLRAVSLRCGIPAAWPGTSTQTRLATPILVLLFFGIAISWLGTASFAQPRD